MRLTDKQFEALKPYQKNFETAVRSRWARLTGTSALDLIHEIYCDVSGLKFRLNKGCSTCILNLLTDMGKIFLADLEERNRTKVEETDKAFFGTSDVNQSVKVEVKVKKPRRTKRKE